MKLYRRVKPVYNATKRSVSRAANSLRAERRLARQAAQLATDGKPIDAARTRDELKVLKRANKETKKQLAEEKKRAVRKAEAAMRRDAGLEDGDSE